jgi:hypothetical protein
MKTRTKGNVIVEDIKVGDIHYEFEYGLGIKCEVITEPVRSDEGLWTWQSKNVNNDNIINYSVSEGLPSYYSLNLYDYEAYSVSHWL